jgi:hypothetical protein
MATRTGFMGGLGSAGEKYGKKKAPRDAEGFL